ncbi:MAG: methionyl-tRNA formyltransferase [Sediminispirochaetaceae bacterium]
MKVLFAGTPQIAVPSLEKIAGHHQVVGVLTNPDRVSGRGRRTLPPPVKVRAGELGLPVYQFETLKREARDLIGPLGADILVVFAFGRIFGPKFLGLFPRGGINIHPSLLPRYRGSIPLVASLLNGDEETGVTVQKIAPELDSGDILMQEAFSLTGRETTAQLSDRAAKIGAELAAKVLDKIEDGTVQSKSQDTSLASYCRKLQKDDGRINWRLPAVMIERMVRAYNPWPKAYTYWQGVQLSILQSHVSDTLEAGEGGPGTVVGVDRNSGILIQTGRGLLCAGQLQLQGKKALHWKDFINGNRSLIGSQLGDN